MAALMEKLTVSGGSESAGFLNDMIEQLWPNINAAGGKMIKEIVEPMFASMLPGPLASLRFVKIDLGTVPIVISAVDVHKTDNGGIKLDMDVVWDGKSDIELDGKMVPKMGIERIHLRGRLSILLAPLTNILPLIGAAQIAFINPPSLKLDFTDAANIADSFLVDKTIRKCIMSIISSMLVLPNRYLVKLDANNDYFKTYLSHVGALRLTIERAVGISGPKKTGAKRLLQKIIKDVPDCYCSVTVGAEEEWRTATKKNDRDPEWSETHDFLIADHDQQILVDVKDDDLMGDDDIGIASTTVKEILLQGGSQELPLTHKGEATEATIVVRAQFFDFVEDAALLSSSSSQGTEEGQIVGLATVLIGGVSNLQGQRDELQPSIRLSWGDKQFATAVKTYTPGTDIFNPSFDQAFRIPLTPSMLSNAPGNFKLTLLNKKDEVGSAEIAYEDVLHAPSMVKEDSFDLGSGVQVRASISVRALRPAQ